MFHLFSNLKMFQNFSENFLWNLKWCLILCMLENRLAHQLSKVWKREEAEERGGIVRKVFAYDSKEARNRIKIKMKRFNPCHRSAVSPSHCNQAAFGTIVNIPHLTGFHVSIMGLAILPFLGCVSYLTYNVYIIIWERLHCRLMSSLGPKTSEKFLCVWGT